VLGDNGLEQVMPGGGSDEGTDGPHNAQFETAVGVEGIRDASVVVVCVAIGGGDGVG